MVCLHTGTMGVHPACIVIDRAGKVATPERNSAGKHSSYLAYLSPLSRTNWQAPGKISAHCVVHGSVNQVTGNTVTQIGNSFTLGDYSVIYRSTIGDNVTVGKKCYIDSTTLPSGTVVPDGTILVKGKNKGTITW